MSVTRIVITPGEPAGVGPELVLQLAQQAWPETALLVVADAPTLERCAAQLALPVVLRRWAPGEQLQPLRAGELRVWHTTVARPARPGELDTANAPYVTQTLRRAVELCTSGQADALVTGPVHKGVINDAGIPFSGHTEFLAELTGAELPVMLLASGALRVALVTTHLPLSQVPGAITRDKLRRTLEILDHDLRGTFGIENPRILVCGLNPHAGESGHLGREEIEVIEPVLADLRAGGMRLDGPVPADTAFLPARLAAADAVLSMYHDQGLPVLKHHGFDQAVNLTLGLPIIRTSVDHGTALELAGTGRADAGSLRAALTMAIELARRRS